MGKEKSEIIGKIGDTLDLGSDYAKKLLDDYGTELGLGVALAGSVATAGCTANNDDHLEEDDYDLAQTTHSTDAISLEPNDRRLYILNNSEIQTYQSFAENRSEIDSEIFEELNLEEGEKVSEIRYVESRSEDGNWNVFIRAIKEDAAGLSDVQEVSRSYEEGIGDTLALHYLSQQGLISDPVEDVTFITEEVEEDETTTNETRDDEPKEPEDEKRDQPPAPNGERSGDMQTYETIDEQNTQDCLEEIDGTDYHDELIADDIDNEDVVGFQLEESDDGWSASVKTEKFTDGVNLEDEHAQSIIEDCEDNLREN